MKYVVVLGDGMADYVVPELNKTPLEAAKKPIINELAKTAKIGLVKTIPDGFKPGSDTANLSVLGYDPVKYYTGRSPLEAYSLGIKMSDTDLALRCNLVTLSDDKNFVDKTMMDYSSGEISTEESKVLIEALQKEFGGNGLDFYAGISYRHCLIIKDGTAGTELTPPHDISGKKIGSYLPNGFYGERFINMYKKSYDLLNNHFINANRINKGLNPANCIWFWGEGTKPDLDKFKDKFNKSGAIISAVDLLKGIGKAADMYVPDVKGATGGIFTDFKAKAQAALEALKTNDFCYIHIESPDECGHQGDAQKKVWAIEQIDEKVLGTLIDGLDKSGEKYAILVLADHPTPVALKTHVAEPVPFLMYQNSKPLGCASEYSEKTGKASGIYYEFAPSLMADFLDLK